MIEPTNLQENFALALSLKHDKVAVTPPQTEGGPVRIECWDRSQTLTGNGTIKCKGLMSTCDYLVRADGTIKERS